MVFARSRFLLFLLLLLFYRLFARLLFPDLCLDFGFYSGVRRSILFGEVLELLYKNRFRGGVWEKFGHFSEKIPKLFEWFALFSEKIHKLFEWFALFSEKIIKLFEWFALFPEKIIKTSV